MASQEDQTRDEYLKQLVEREQKVAEGIAEVIKLQTGDAKDRHVLVKQGVSLQKSHRTLGGDLTRNVKDMKEGISTTVDGMINETFGPLGGVVTTFTTGFFKRGKENKDNLSATEATLELAEANLEEIQGGKVEAKTSMSSLESEQKKTTRAVARGRETAEEEENEDDRQHEEVVDALEDLKGGKGEKPSLGDDGGFFAGMGLIASTLGGIALGLTAGTWFPPIKELSKITSIFDTKFPKWTKGIKKFFNIADDLPDLAKTITKIEDWSDGTRRLVTRRGTQFVTHTKDLKKIADAGGIVTDASKTTKAARTLFGIKVPGMFSSVGDKIADVGKHLDGAKDIIKTKGLAKGLTSVAGKTALSVVGGTLGRAFKIAGGPVFDVAAMGKDMYDIASVTLDDDITTSWKGQDLGGIIGGVVGGAIGMAVGMPWLGVGLGNMAGEFIGAALEQPEVIKGIATAHQNVVDELAPVKARILETTALMEAGVAERAALQTQLDAATTEEEKQRLTNLIARNDQQNKIFEGLKAADEAKSRALTAELDNIETLQPKINEVEATANAVNELYKKRTETEAKIERARSEGNTAAVIAYEGLLKGIEADITKGEADYEKQNEELRTLSQQTSSRVAEKTTNLLDQMATLEGGFGGFFGDLMEGLGLADRLVGKGRKKLLIGKAQKDIEEAEKEQLELEDKITKLKEGDQTQFTKNTINRLNIQLKREQKKKKDAEQKIADQESGQGDIDRISDIEKEIAAIEDDTWITDNQREEVKSLLAEKAELDKEVSAREKKKVTTKKESAKALEKAGGHVIPRRTTDAALELEAQQQDGGHVIPRRTTDAAIAAEQEGGGHVIPRRTTDAALELEAQQQDGGHVIPRRTTDAALGQMHQGGPIKTSGTYELLAGEMVMDNQAAEIIKSSVSVAGAIMNQMMLEKIGGGNGAGAAAGPTIVDAKTVNNVVNNNTQIRSPSPSGQYMFAEKGDFVGIRKIA